MRFIFFIPLLLASCLANNNSKVKNESQEADSFFPDEKVKEILELIKEPFFPDRVYNIADYGAVGDNKTDCSEAIQKAITACSEGGGGKVLIPEGIYQTKAIHLKSNVNLHIGDGAVLKFSTNPQDYLPLVKSRWEGVDCYNYSPLIYAYQQENIAITGKGTLDGQSDNTHWWPWKGRIQYGYKPGMDSQLKPESRDLLLSFEQESVPIEERKMGEGHFLRPPFIQTYECKNILIEDIIIERAPFWLIHPVFSENIIVRGIVETSNGPNNDGCDPESCKNVLIEDCYFNNGDDCIAIKSGRNNDGRKWNIPSKNIIIRNCEMKNGHGGVVIGSEVSGGCSDVFVYDCKMNSPELDRAIRIKTNAIRGGLIENVYVKNIEIGQVKESVLKINCQYEIRSEKGEFPPLIQNIYLENITSKESKYPLYLVGLSNHKSIKNIYILNSRFDGVKKNNKIAHVEGLHTENLFINGKLFSADE